MIIEGYRQAETKQIYLNQPLTIPRFEITREVRGSSYFIR